MIYYDIVRWRVKWFKFVACDNYDDDDFPHLSFNILFFLFFSKINFPILRIILMTKLTDPRAK